MTRPTLGLEGLPLSAEGTLSCITNWRLRWGALAFVLFLFTLVLICVLVSFEVLGISYWSCEFPDLIWEQPYLIEGLIVFDLGVFGSPVTVLNIIVVFNLTVAMSSRHPFCSILFIA